MFWTTGTHYWSITLCLFLIASHHQMTISTHCPKCSIGWQWHIRCHSHVMGILLTICYLPLMLYSQSRKWSKYPIQLLSTLGRKTSIVPNRGVTTLPVDNIPRFPCILVSYLKTQCWLWAGFPLCWSIGAW